MTQPKMLKSLSSDIPASIVVFLVALPLCLGVALASNAPLFSGIIAGMVGGMVVGLISQSHLSVSGPAAGLTSIVAAAIITLPSYEAFLVAVVLCGCIQVLFGFLKLGVIGDYVPSAVIKAMLAAIGIILILNQFPHLLGDDSHFETDEGVQPADKGNIFSNFANAFFHITPAALAIGGTCLALHFVWEAFVQRKQGNWKLVPAPLLVVVLGVFMNQLFAWFSPEQTLVGEHLVAIPKAANTTEFWSFFTQPDWSAISNMHILTTGLTLALVASLESLLSIEAVDDLDPYKRVTPTNLELKAQGVGNIVSGLLGGLPVTSVIVRSSANVNAGAKSKVSTILHGALLLLSVAFIPQLLNLIPKAALAAILVFTGYKLAKPSLFKSFYAKGMNQFLPFIITIVAILTTDLLKGVLIGMGVGLYFIVKSNFKRAVLIVHDNNNYLFRLRQHVAFLNKGIIRKELEKVPENAYVIIDATKATFIDRDVAEEIEDYVLHAPLKKIKVELKMNPYHHQFFSPDVSLLSQIVEENKRELSIDQHESKNETI
jgi:MFS superfamily sulfate permease-like transporter